MVRDALVSAMACTNAVLLIRAFEDLRICRDA